MTDDSPLRIGISSCLLGEEVRYNGGHKRDAFLTDTLGEFVEWVPVCPEVEVGMGTPRETIRLERDGDDVRLVAPGSGTDHTESMQRFSEMRVEQLRSAGLSGYVLKKDSPSCGLMRVRVYNDKGMPAKDGIGVFARELVERFPGLPIEEEGRLKDPRLRENFVERVFAYRRLRELFEGDWSIGDLVRFHTVHKLTLMAHSPADYKRLGRFVAEAADHPPDEVQAWYGREFMDAMTKLSTPRKHANVLQHMLGYITDDLDSETRSEILTLIEDHRTGLAPLIVPLTLIRHYVRLQQVEYLLDQAYLNPHPKELQLLNHV